MKTSVLFCMCASIVLSCGALAANAEQVSLGQSKVCGMQSARPDRNAAALKEKTSSKGETGRSPTTASGAARRSC